MIVSCLDTMNPPADYSVYITKQELLNFVEGESKRPGKKNTGKYSYIKSQLENLITPITILNENGDEITVALLTKYIWLKDVNIVKFTFDEDIWPYLIGLKQHFLQYNILQIRGFKSKFSLEIYENLLSHTRQSESKFVVIDMQNIRYFTDTQKKYKEFKDFEKNVLKPAKKEINSDKCIEFLFDYKKIQPGRSITAIEFHLKKRTSMDDTWDYTKYPERLAEEI